MESPPQHAEKPVLKQLTQAAQFLGAASIVLMLLISAFAAAQRYLFHTSGAWISEVEKYLLLFAVFIVAGSAYTEGDHVSADLLLRRLPPRARRIATAAIDILGLGFCVFMFRQGASQVLQLHAAGLKSNTSLQTPLFLVAALLPVSMVLLGIAFAFHLAHTLRKNGIESRDPDGHDGTAPH